MAHPDDNSGREPNMITAEYLAALDAADAEYLDADATI